MSAGEDAVRFLESLGLGTYLPDEAGGDLFRHAMPAEPDAVGVVYDTGGSGPDFKFGQAAIGYDWPSMGIRFRGAPHDHEGPRVKAMTAYDAFAAINIEPVNGTTYLSMRPLQPPFPIVGPDEDERPVWGFNVLAHQER